MKSIRRVQQGLAVLSLLLLAGVVNLGCAEKCAEPEPYYVLSLVDPKPVHSVNQRVVTEPVAVYVDNSGPMKNFVSKTADKSVYSEVLQCIGSDPWDDPSIECFWFGEHVTPIDGNMPLTEAGADRTLYDDQWTRLAELIDTLTSRLLAGDSTTSLVITDFVQSNSADESGEQTDWSRVADDISRFLGVGSWELLGIQSKYAGTHTSEIDNSHFEVSAVRPFYIMVFGPDQNHVRAVVDKLRVSKCASVLQNMTESINPKARSLVVSWLDVDHRNELHEDGPRNAIGIRNDILDGRMLQIHWNGVEARNSVGRLRLKILCRTGEQRPPLMSPQHPSFRMEWSARPWCGELEDSSEVLGGFTPVAVEHFALDTVEGSANLESDSCVYVLDCRIRAPQGLLKGQHEVMRFQLWAEPDSISLPPWVEDWSTRDDRGVDQIGKTLNLDKTVDRIVRKAVAEYPLFTGWFIVKGR